MKIAADGEILVRGDNVTSGYFNAAGRNGARLRGRLVPHRRHRRDRRRRPAVHPRPQEGDDRHARRAERLSGGRRARAEHACRACASRRSSARASAPRNACTPCSCSMPGADADDDRAPGERAARAITRRSAARSSGPSPSCRAPKGTRKLKRAVDPRLGEAAAAAPRLVAAGHRPLGGAARAVRGPRAICRPTRRSRSSA